MFLPVFMPANVHLSDHILMYLINFLRLLAENANNLPQEY